MVYTIGVGLGIVAVLVVLGVDDDDDIEKGVDGTDKRRRIRKMRHW